MMSSHKLGTRMMVTLLGVALCLGLAIPLLSMDIALGAPLIFVSDRAGTRDIWRMDGAELSPLTSMSGPNHDVFEDYPVPSPDGSRIAFISNAGTTGAGPTPGGLPGTNIWVINSDGSGLQRLTPYGIDPGYGNAYSRQPVWSPDGLTIAFNVRTETDRFLASVPSDGSSDPSRLTDDRQTRYDERYSPDGNKLLYQRDQGTGWWKLSELDLPTGIERDVPGADANHSIAPDYSNDGSCIAYLEAHLSKGLVRRMDADYGNNIVLWDYGAEGFFDQHGHLAWSPNDRFLAVNLRPTINPPPPDRRGGIIQILDPTTPGEKLHRIDQGSNLFAMDWAAYDRLYYSTGNDVWNENSELVYMSDRDGDWDIYTARFDGTQWVEQPLLNSPYWEGSPVWIPEPSTWAMLLGLGATTLLWRLRRRRGASDHRSVPGG